MLRDIELASEDRINISKQIFLEQNVPCRSFPVEPISMSSKTFSDRIPSISKPTARYIFNRLQRNHWLNSYNYLLYNPRRKTSWKNFILTVPSDNVIDKSIFKNINDNIELISELLNTAYGEHAITYERGYEALEWTKRVSNISQTQT